jgi:predicted transcriptional regulator
MTKRSGSALRLRTPLTDLENEVMSVVWEREPCSVETVHEAISKTRNFKEATTRTLLRRLELKGYLRHEEQRRAYLYRSVEPARSLAARAVRQIMDRFCRGSVEELVSGMVDAKVLSKGDLQRLEDYVRSRREGGV